ncbi:TetR/AcrR family transcriptional regulator [Sphingobium boeckii]|uniref:AcrR family transcriptional regulator n=1 Tax=Sphingobium boeckii TaxID=1082345 RepID=A0A7W9ALG9_9SPHN|nr:TetR/AcrR family transcriptional regulator [Sphingobium boeckii]MBB5687862.1 AcrR family transcriptional regulator [Sphingobium boeckii]
MANIIVETAETPSIDNLDGKIRLILAGEQLFAKNGINGASMREIATKAGQGNHAAVQYHFGSREGLVRAIFDYRMDQMETARGAMLDNAQTHGRLKDARTILEIILLPQLDLQDADGNHSYASFLSQYLLQSRSPEFGDFSGSEPPNLTRALHLMRERIDYLPPFVAQRRLISVSLMFLNILMRHHGTDESAFGETFSEALEDTMEQIVEGMCMPLRLASAPSENL